MTIQTLGISMVVRGAERMARDISHVALSLYNYSKAVNSAEKTLLRMSQSAVRQATSGLNSQQRVVNTLTNAYNSQSNSVRQLQASVTAMTDSANRLTTARRMVTYWTNEVRLLNEQYRMLRMDMRGATRGSPEFRQIERDMRSVSTALAHAQTSLRTWRSTLRDSQTATRDLAGEQSDLASAQTDLASTTAALTSESARLLSQQNMLAKAQEELDAIMSQSTGIMATLGKFFSVLSGGYGSNIRGATQLDTRLLQLGLRGAAAGMALNVITLALDALAIGFKLALGAVKLVINIFKTLITVAWNVGSSIVKGVVGALKTLVSIPFRIAASGLNAVWQSIKRIGEIAIGMNLSNLIWNTGTKIKDMGVEAFNAAADFQMLELRLQGLIAREIANADSTKTITGSLNEAIPRVKELTYWISKLAVQTPFGAEEIANSLSLAMSYDMTEKEAKKLTESVLNFATGMGLGNSEMTRIIENFGQMKAQGKITGTELRDLARGAFLPINRILDLMGQNLGLDTEKIGELRSQLQEMTSTGEISLTEFFTAFEQMVARDFPDAVGRMSKSWKTAANNVKDFIQTVIGWRVLTPIVGVLGEKLQTFVSGLMTPQSIKLAERFGNALGIIGKFAFKVSESFSGNINTNINKFVSRLTVVLDLVKKIADLKNSKAWSTQFDKIIGEDITELAFRFSQFGIALPTAKKLAGPITDLAAAFFNLDKAPVGESVSKITKAVKEIGKIVWEDIIIPDIKKLWENIKGKLVTIWGWITTEIGSIIDTVVKPWWESEGQAKFIGMIESISTWIEESGVLSTIGSKIALGIASGFEAAQNSGWIQTIQNILVAALSGAAAAAISAMTGILSGAGTVTDNTGSGENIAQPEWVKDQETGGMFAPIMKAIEELKVTAQQALDDALNKFNEVLGEIVDKANGDFTGLSQFSQTVVSISQNGQKAMDAVASIKDSLVTIFDIDPSFASSFSGFAADLDFITKIALTPLYIIRDVLSAIASIVERINANKAALDSLKGLDLPPSLQVPGTKISQESAGKSIPGLGGWDLSGVEENAKNIEGIINGIKQKIIDSSDMFGPMLTESTESTGTLKADWETLSTDLVGASIIPDMMTDILKSMSEGFDAVLKYIEGTFIPTFIGYFKGLDLTGEGKRIIQSLQSGMASSLASLKSWWEANNKFSVTVTITEVTNGSGGSGGSGGKVRKKSASGANFVVPSGYPNDSYLMGVQTGEQVIVIPNALRSLMARQNNTASMWNYKSAGVSNINNSRATTNNYYLNVNSTRELETIETEFGIMRLSGE